ncbi:MAG: oligosaccharide flippase family protein [Bacteroidota bacterium]
MTIFHKKVHLVLLNLYQRQFKQGNIRSIKAKKNIILSIGLKGISIIIGLIYVPLLLDVFDKERYGVWLTVSSLVLWFGFLDLGLGNGFRNKFSEAIAKNNQKLAKEYVSTIYISLGAVSICIIPIFIIVNSFLNWNLILNTNVASNGELSLLSLTVFLSFIFRFVLQLIGQILMADQRPALNNSFNLIGNIISLTLILIVGKIMKVHSLPILGLILSISPVLVLFIATIFFFKTYYKQYSPSFKHFKIKHIRSLLSLGVFFFFIQIASLVINYSTNILIAQFCSIKDVSVYNVVQRLFTVGTMLFSIVLMPMWSAITEAYYKDEIAWIKNSMKKLFRLALLLSSVTFLLLIFSKVIFKLWIGNRLDIPFSLCVIEALRTLIFMFFGPFSTFLNGVSKIRLNVYMTLVETIFFIPLAYIMSKYMNMGIIGILLAAIIIEIPLRVCQPIQYFMIINKKAYGIWDK